MKKHFQVFGTVHLGWVILILSLTVVGLLSAELGTNAGIKDILNFAVSFSSLILALVAITQALISSSAMGETIQQITSSMSGITKPAMEISEAAKTLNILSEKIDLRAGEISQHLSLANSPQLQEQPPGGNDDLLSSLTNGGALAFYMSIQASSSKKWFNPVEVMDGSTTGDYIQGFIAALRAAGIMDVELKDNKFRVRDLGKVSRVEDDIKAQLIQGNDETVEWLAEQRKKIDGFFTRQRKKGAGAQSPSNSSATS